MTIESITTPDVALPPDTVSLDGWQGNEYRVISGPDRRVPGVDGIVGTSAVQYADGSIDQSEVDSPRVWTDITGALTAQQARQIAGALVAAADEIDGWADAGAARMRALTAAIRATREAYDALATAPGNAGDYLRAALDSITEATALVVTG